MHRLLQYWIIDIINFVAEWILSYMPRRGPTQNGKTAIVRLDALGDYILWRQSGQHIRDHYGIENTILIASTQWATLARQLDGWEHMFEIDPVRFRESTIYRIRMLYRIRSLPIARMLNPTYSRNFFLDDSVVRHCSCTLKVGWETDLSNMPNWQKRCSDGWYSELIKGKSEHAHELDRNTDFARTLTGVEFQIEIPDKKLRAYGLATPFLLDQPYFVVAPTSLMRGKQWPTENFSQIASHVIANRGWKLVAVGTKSDHPTCEELCSKLGGHAINMAGQTSITELIGLLSGARLVICNDSASAHLSMFLATPAVIILGGGHFGRFLPYPFVQNSEQSVKFRPMECYDCAWQCQYEVKDGHPFPCVATISVAELIQTIESLPSYQNETHLRFH